ncbi:MAG TPA: phage holin family protein [Solirubrobacterales bacterium]|jgi:hypothetical protein
MDGRENNLRRSSTGELLKHLSEQTTELIRKEIELAKAELSQKGKVAGAGAGLLGGAAALGLLAAGALTAFIVLLLSEAMDAWLAALIVSVIYAAIAAALALAGRERVRAGMPPAPEQTVESVKEDVQWAKNRAKSVRR